LSPKLIDVLRLEPILYEIIIYKHHCYRSPGRSRIITNGKLVRHLLLRKISPDLAWDYLHSCTNLQTLSFTPDGFGLSFDFSNEFDEYQLFPSIDLPDNCPKYEHLTHLQLMTLSPLDKINWLANLPNLTHLLILSPMYNLDKAVNPIFARCHRIRVMLWCPWDPWFGNYDQYRDHFIAHSKGWWMATNAWKMGEEIVNKRL